MNARIRSRWLGGLVALAPVALVVGTTAQPVRGVPLGTAFTYQGQLQQSGAPTTGTCDLQFDLFAAPSAGSTLGTQSKSSVGVTSGLFTVELDFGDAAFAGEDRYLEIRVRCPAGSGSLSLLSPRQRLTAAPYALYARSAGSASDLACSGCVDGGSELANASVTAAKLSGPGFGSGKVLKYNDGAVAWDADGLTLPYSGTTSSGSTAFSVRNTSTGHAVFGGAHNAGSAGVYGYNDSSGIGVWGVSTSDGVGVWGSSPTNKGVYGSSTSGTGVYGSSGGGGDGVVGTSTSGDGVRGIAPIDGTGVHGSSLGGLGVYGESNSFHGVIGTSTSGHGVHGSSGGGDGVVGVSSTSGTGVHGISTSGSGVYGQSTTQNGVIGRGGNWGVYGLNSGGTAWGYLGGTTVGVYGNAGTSGTGQAGAFDGNVHVNGTLTKTSGSFKIDHPLDPSGKYLYHSFVESPDMMNIYNGNVVTDEDGLAVIELPEWFETLNRDFRYQLTAIGAPGPSLYVAEEVHDHRFKIAGGKAGLKVSWQITGIRHDPYAEANRIRVEEDKPLAERGTYLHPKEYGMPDSTGLYSLPNAKDSGGAS